MTLTFSLGIPAGLILTAYGPAQVPSARFAEGEEDGALYSSDYDDGRLVLRRVE